MQSDRSSLLSKSRYCYGLQCLRQLWWRVHEPKAPELVPGPALAAVLARGHAVGVRAQAEVPGGTLIGHEYWEIHAKAADTVAALRAAPPAIYEASFIADGVFVAVDILERRGRSHTIVEVKSSCSVKDQYIPDVAIQLHVLRASGVDVAYADVMHLNSACRYPDLSDLFAREDVTAEAELLLPGIPDQLERMRRALAGDLPAVEIGPHCDEPYECPFKGRCWPALPEHHVSTLYRAGKLAQKLVTQGIESVRDIPDSAPLRGPQRRQVRAVRTGRPVVEDGLTEALASLEPPVAYLDFETVAPAIPVWNGCGPYMAVPVQLSCHVVTARGATSHFEHLAEGPGDPRPAIAEAVVRACAGAKTVVAYNATFERRCLEHLAEHVPARREALQGVIVRLVDLLPIVRDHVYHPAFHGSFGMKAVAPALVPDIGYDGLAIADGSAATTALEGLLLDEEAIPAGERMALRRQLLDYCRLDTLAMVRVVEALRALG